MGSPASLGSADANAYGSDPEGKDKERWLKGLRVSASQEDKPSLLHALVLHLIKHERYRPALDELETYLPSYPYLLSAPLHTYAGLLSFYLAQPPTSQQRGTTASSSISRDSSPVRRDRGLPNEGLLRQSRNWFTKALEIDEGDEVAMEFIRQIDEPENGSEGSDLDMDESKEDTKEDYSSGSEEEEEDEGSGDGGYDDDQYEDILYEP